MQYKRSVFGKEEKRKTFLSTYLVLSIVLTALQRIYSCESLSTVNNSLTKILVYI